MKNCEISPGFDDNLSFTTFHCKAWWESVKWAYRQRTVKYGIWIHNAVNVVNANFVYHWSAENINVFAVEMWQMLVHRQISVNFHSVCLLNKKKTTSKQHQTHTFTHLFPHAAFIHLVSVRSHSSIQHGVHSLRIYIYETATITHIAHSALPFQPFTLHTWTVDHSMTK